jgi:hypothetical protein
MEISTSSSTSHPSLSPSLIPVLTSDTFSERDIPSLAQKLTLPNSTASTDPQSSSSSSALIESSIRPGVSKHRQSTLSTSSSRSNRPGLFTLASLRDKTTNAIASFAEPAVRPRLSSSSLYKLTSPTSVGATPLSQSARSSSTTLADSSQDRSELFPPSTLTTGTIGRSRTPDSSSSTPRHSLLETYPPSQAYDSTDPNTPAPVPFTKPVGNQNKMHQTSSRLLRMTDDERPFTRVRHNY